MIIEDFYCATIDVFLTRLYDYNGTTQPLSYSFYAIFIILNEITFNRNQTLFIVLKNISEFFLKQKRFYSVLGKTFKAIKMASTFGFVVILLFSALYSFFPLF